MKKTLSIVLAILMIAASLGLVGNVKEASAQAPKKEQRELQNAPVYSAYFAEGYTMNGFETWLLMSNPYDIDAQVEVQYLLTDAEPVVEEYTIPANSRYTVFVNDVVNGEVSMAINSLNSVEFIAERAMYFNNRAGGHVSIPTRYPSNRWFFAEGMSAGGFEEYLLLSNPTDSDSDVNVRLLKNDGTTIDNSYTVNAMSRKTIYINDIYQGENSIVVYTQNEESSIVAERAMYWGNRTGGTDTIGSDTASSEWFFAEGMTAQGFEEWLLLANPFDYDSIVDIDYVDPTGEIVSTEVTVPAFSRKTINVNSIVNGENSIEVRVIDGANIVAERAMYWKNRDDGSAVIGSLFYDSTFVLAEGYTGGNFQEYLLILNPTDSDTVATVSFLTSTGDVATEDFNVGAHTRVTVYVNDYVNGENSIIVRADDSDGGYVVVERAMYWNNMSGGDATIGQFPYGGLAD